MGAFQKFFLKIGGGGQKSISPPPPQCSGKIAEKSPFSPKIVLKCPFFLNFSKNGTFGADTLK